MKSSNFDKYFNPTNNNKYNSKILINILEDIYKKDIKTIEYEIKNQNINVDSVAISKYLNTVFEQETSNNKAQNVRNERYIYKPYTLEYFKKYISIVKAKTIILLSIIEKINNKQFKQLNNLLNNFDIQIDEDGNMSREDIIRLIVPTINNINDLYDQVNKANDLNSYLLFKLSKELFINNGISLEELYPTVELQIQNSDNNHIVGNIPLSKKQFEKIKKYNQNNQQF